MIHSVAAIVRYERPLDSVRTVVRMSGGLDRLSADSRIFIKPNIVYWSKEVPFPKWGVITTSRVVEDMVVLLKEQGVNEITIGEGTVLSNPKDTETPAHAFKTLGYPVLKRRYGARFINIHERPFKKIDLGEGVSLSINRDILQSDVVVDIPVLKTHSQTVVSLGIKNLKGTLNIRSRQKCHSNDPIKDLNYMVARLPRAFPPCFTILDGIYTNEWGPGFDGRIRRSNLLVASWDLLSADMVGAHILGYEPREVPHLAHAARDRKRPTDLSDMEIVGEPLEGVSSLHKYSFPYTEDGSLPIGMKKIGIKGLSYWKYDLTLCTYCSSLTRVVLPAIAKAWKGEPWDDVEVLTGKTMRPRKGKKKTILFGKCIYQANKDNPHIREMIPIKGCPPSPKQIIEAFHTAGIPVDRATLENMGRMPGTFMKRYRDKPEFDESHFTVV
ncbi:MAG: DUF362 domain-containing protein [Deltaproteobacteria bacterium]|nr:DUF362 domain-containing protein [Deltaproteobacteria bacterium]